MQTFIVIIGLLLVIGFILEKNRKIIPATKNDWLVRFYVDKEKRIASINFYPVIAFNVNNDLFKIITLWRVENKNLKMQGESNYCFFRWVRDDAMYEENGFPDAQTFSNIIYSFLSDGMVINSTNSTPYEYANIIEKTIKKLEKDTGKTY